MAFDPTLPQENTDLDAAQVRAQFNALKGLIDALTTRAAALETRVETLEAQNVAQQGQIDVLNGQLSGVMGTFSGLSTDVGALQMQLSASGSIAVSAISAQSATIDGNVSGGGLVSNGNIQFGGRWNMQVDGAGNVVLMDGVTGWSTTLTSIPI